VQNVTAGNGGATDSVVVSTFDSSGDTLAANIFTNYIRFFTQSGGSFGTGVDLAFTDPTIGQGKFSPASPWMAVSGSSNNVYLLKPSGSTYAINQTFAQTSSINTLAWAYNGERLIVGLSNGSVIVYAYNRTNDQFYASQTINTTHTNVFAVAGTLSRFATCGPDSNVLVYYFSQKTGLYTLNQTVSSVISATGCTALDFAPTELNIVVGRGKNVAVLTRDQNFVYSVSSPLMADDEGVTYAKFTTDGIYFVTGGNSTKLWTRANGFTASSQTLNLGTVSGDWTNNNYRYALGVLQRTPNIDNILQLRATGCTTSQNTTNPTQCNCGASVWSNGTCTTLSCTGVQNSNGAATADGWACVCNTGFVWDANLGVCKTDCSPAVTPNSNGTNYEYLSCFCNSGYFWNYTLGVCYVNCAGQANSNGTNVNPSSMQLQQRVSLELKHRPLRNQLYRPGQQQRHKPQRDLLRL
jgi:hypothetical protein